MFPVAETQLPDPTSAQSIGWVVVILFGLFGSINQVLKFFDRFRASPPLHKEYATITDLKELEKAHLNFRAEVRLSFDDAADQSRSSREKIYVEQRRQSELLAANTQKTDLTHQRVELLDTKIDRLLERISTRDR